jgi:hypothetical protein
MIILHHTTPVSLVHSTLSNIRVAHYEYKNVFSQTIFYIISLQS